MAVEFAHKILCAKMRVSLEHLHAVVAVNGRATRRTWKSRRSSADQVIENEQREGLKPLEIALFVQKCLASGDSQAEIARGSARAGST